MFSRLRLPVNQYLKDCSKTAQFRARNLRKNSTTCHVPTPECQTICAAAISETEKCNANLNPASASPTNSKPFSLSPEFTKKYRLSTYREPLEIHRDKIESELLDLENSLDPANQLRIFHELNEEMEKRSHAEKLDYGQSGPIIWNLIF